jgi:hypothetical protein
MTSRLTVAFLQGASCRLGAHTYAVVAPGSDAGAVTLPVDCRQTPSLTRTLPGPSHGVRVLPYRWVPEALTKTTVPSDNHSEATVCRSVESRVVCI